ncbi:hypothetical protein EGW08_000246 [Elysia chlorotica]|uniref:Protein kinase domain-containing protein n=1 Tax=Elysia chlorotica TaxID=188477 RepID=A0A3S1A6U1_ELYCH|nr:hypothetical protein EGW08_000246 [Elysia chlorotica]
METRFYAEELVCALDFLHSKGMIHRKFTAGNIKITAEGHIQVYNMEDVYIAIDNNGERQESPEAEGIVGLDAYMPPEMVDRKVYSYTVDWWNLGVVLYFMMTGKMPFQGLNKRELHRGILYKEPRFEIGLHTSLTHSLVKCFLKKDPRKRLGFRGTSQVMEHKYFSSTNWKRVMNGENDPPFLPETSAVTSLPSRLCASLEDLYGGEPVQKSFSRRDIERQQDINLAPAQYIDFELEHDWTVYLLPKVRIETAMHFMHGELRPPTQDDVPIEFNECITKVPELSPEEKNIFRKYASGGCGDAEPFEKRVMEDGSFRMLTREQAQIYDQDPDAYNFHDIDNDMLDRDISATYLFSKHLEPINMETSTALLSPAGQVARGSSSIAGSVSKVFLSDTVRDFKQSVMKFWGKDKREQKSPTDSNTDDETGNV